MFCCWQVAWQRKQLVQFHKEKSEASKDFRHEDKDAADEEIVSGSLGWYKINDDFVYLS